MRAVQQILTSHFQSLTSQKGFNSMQYTGHSMPLNALEFFSVHWYTYTLRMCIYNPMCMRNSGILSTQTGKSLYTQQSTPIQRVHMSARISTYTCSESGAQLYDVCRSSAVHRWKGPELSIP